MSEGEVAPTKPAGLMTPDLDLALENLLKKYEGRMILAEMLKTMFFMQPLTDEKLMVAHEGGVLWYERMYMVSKANTLKLINDHFMEGGT